MDAKELTNGFDFDAPKVKHNPRNKQEAYCFQILDDVKVLHILALTEDKQGFNNQVDIIVNRLNQIKFQLGGNQTTKA